MVIRLGSAKGIPVTSRSVDYFYALYHENGTYPSTDLATVAVKVAKPAEPLRYGVLHSPPNSRR